VLFPGKSFPHVLLDGRVTLPASFSLSRIKHSALQF
jgi:hypothetical protein